MDADVIVGWDAGAEARDAIALGRLLAGRDGSVVAVCVHGGDAAAHGLPSTGEARAALAALAADAPGTDRVAVESSCAAAGLISAAVTEGISTIVVGSSRHGPPGMVHTGGTGRSLVGRTAQAVAIPPRGYHSTMRCHHRVLAVLDGAHQLGAVREAAALGRSLQASVLVLGMIPELAPWARNAGCSVGSSWENLGRQRRAYFERLLRRATEGLDRVETRVVAGADLPVVLADLTERADVLVTGPAATGALEREVAGITSGAPRGARCPVLVCAGDRAVAPRRLVGPRRTGTPVQSPTGG